MASITRRRFLAGTGVAAGAVAAQGWFPAVLRAQTDPFRIGCPLPLTGPFAALAADMQRGAQLAQDELNAKAARWRYSSATISSSPRWAPSAPRS